MPPICVAGRARCRSTRTVALSVLVSVSRAM